MSNTKAFLNLPIDFQNICKIYSPTINDIVANDEYSMYQKLLTISQEEIYDSLSDQEKLHNDQDFTIPLEIDPTALPKPLKRTDKVVSAPTPLEYLLINCYHDKLFLKIVQNAFYFFTHLEILPMYDIKSIYIGELEKITTYKTIEELPLLNESNYLQFQNAIRSLLNMPIVSAPDPDEDPRITRMKAKARYRDQIKAKGGDSIGLNNILVAICCMGIGITPLNIGEMSYGAIIEIFKTYQAKEKYELDTSCLLAGADSKKIKPKYWITN